MMIQDPYAPRYNENELFPPPQFNDQSGSGDTSDTLAQIQALAPYLGASYPPPAQQQQQKSSGSVSGLMSLFG